MSALELIGVEHVGLERDRGLAEASRQRLERLTPSREQADPCARCGESSAIALPSAPDAPVTTAT